MYFSKIHIFIPVYNRGDSTANFVSHLLPQLSLILPFQLWIIDDGCTDQTVFNVQRICASVEVVRLSGNSYWGGSLNTIRKEILLRRDKGITDECYLVCNDDIRFPEYSIIVALNSLRSNNVVCALPTVVSQNDIRHARLPSDLLVDRSPMHRFDSRQGKFVVETNPELVNTASTYAMLTTSEPWAVSDPVPDTIPHYLSDWWLTYEFHRNGFSVTHPKGFRCFTCSETTKNSTLIKYVPYGFRGLRPWISHLLCVLRASADKSSPYYALAWITLLKTCSENPLTLLLVVRYYLLYFLGTCLRIFSSTVKPTKSGVSR